MTFHDMPDGLTPLSPTSEPGTWLVAGAGARQPGGAIAPPFMIWSEGQPQPTEIAGSWEAWTAARHSTGLIWLRGPTAWALLHADGSITQLPEGNAPTYETDISPDGSVLLVGSSGCGLGDVATCRVHAIDAVSGAEISTLPGEGLTAWGDDGGLFVMLGGPGSPALFLIRDSGVTTLTFPAWTQ